MPWLSPGPEAADLLPAWFIDHWRELALVNGQADPFCCGPVWNLAYHKAIAPERGIYYAASERGALIFGRSETAYGEPVLLPLEDSWLYGNPILGDEGPGLLAHVLEDLLNQFAPQSPLFLISGIIARSLYSRRLAAILPRGWGLYRYSRNKQCSASLDGGLDGWLSRRSANTRQALRKSMKKAANAGISYERIRPEPEEVDAVYERILAIEARSWKGLDHCGMAESPSREFYAEMIRLLALTGSALVIFASIDGEDIGFIFGGLQGSYYRGQQFSFANEWGYLSPGNLMQMEKIRWLAELGISRYDMGPAVGPRMEYKRRWTENFQEFETWIMCRDC